MREQIFIKTARPVREVAELLAGWFDLEPIPDAQDSDTDIGLRGRARTVEGHLGIRVCPNNHVLPDAEADGIQAIDTYEIQVDIWYDGLESDAQQREARVVFDRFVHEWPGVAMLLCHELTFLVAVHLPNVGVHAFPPRTTMDAPDLELWRPWITGLSSWEHRTYDHGSALDQAVVQRACSALAAWHNERPLGPDDWCRPEDFARWNMSLREEWLMFTTSGGYGSGAYLVCEDTVYAFMLTEQSDEDALRSARALRDSQRPWWRRLGTRRHRS